MPLRADPVPDLPARRTPPPLRVVRLDHRLPAAAIRRFRHRFERQDAKAPKRTRDGIVGEVRRRAGVQLERRRLRKTHPRLLGQARQELARRAKARPADAAEPVLPLAELAGRRGPRRLAALAGQAEPLHCLRRDPTHADLHGRVIRMESGPG